MAKSKAQPNVRLAHQGRMFTEEGLNIAWGLNGSREVASLDSVFPGQGRMEWPAAVQRAVLNDILEYTDEPATGQPVLEGGTQRILTGEEARAHMALPAGPLTATMVSQITGEAMEVDLTARIVPPEFQPGPASDAAPGTGGEARGEEQVAVIPEADAAAVEKVDFKSMSKGDLEVVAEELGVDPSGTKAEILERIEALDTATAPVQEDAPGGAEPADAG